MAGEKKNKEETQRWKVAEIPTQTAPMIFDEHDKKVYSIEQALVLILNNQEALIKHINE